MNRIFMNFMKLLVSIFSLKHLQCKICPTIITNYNPLVDQGYIVKNFFKIPQTNVLIINTFKKDSQDYNIVYYNDMTSSAGEIINVIQPDYIIIDMSYIYNQDKILAMSYDRIVIANPYTLKSEKRLPIVFLVHVRMVEKTKFAIATLKQYIINIIDVETMAVIKVLDNIKYPNVFNTFNYYTKCFSRPQENQYLLMTVNSYGFYTWTVDLFSLNTIYNDYIGLTIVNHTDYANRQFTKHPTRDIFFVGGTNLEILAFEIVDITTQTYRQQMKLNLYDSKYKLNTTNIVYKSSAVNTTYPMLIIGDGTYVYDLALTFDDVNQTIKIPTYLSPPYTSDFPTFYVWYEMPEEQDKRIIMSGNEYITIYNYQTRSFGYNLFYGTDWFSRRFMYEGNGQSYFAFIRPKSVQYFNRTNLSTQVSFNPNITFKPYYEVNGVYRVKNCNECILLKTAENTTKNHFLNQVIMYPQKNTFNTSLNVTDLGFKWNEVNMNLDPFYYKNQTWIAFGFRNKSSDKQHLFTMVNMHDSTQNFNLTGTDKQNSRQSSYAMAAIDDPNNLEIIGVDFLGYVYVWDFLTKAMKYARKPLDQGKYCLNSDIGTIYQQNNKKWLIFVCEDRRVLSYDFEKNTTQLIRTLATNPLALKSFPSIGIIAFGDTQTGDAFIYKISNGIFNYFLTIQPGYLKDRLLSIELLSDNTIWVQYFYSNILYSLGDCINDVNDCLKCEETYYFNTTFALDSSFTYGNGTSTRPYTSPYSFLTAMLKAQRYQNRISGISGMNVNIIIDPQYKMIIPKEYLNFEFSSIILLTIKSKIENKLATLDFNDKLEFSNYIYVGLQDIQIDQIITKQQYACGINFYNIKQNATLYNIKLFNSNQTDLPQLNCYQIYAEQTKLQVFGLSIRNQDFSSHESIISTLYTDWINIQSLSLDNCLIGDNFSIVKQNGNLKTFIKSVNITNNTSTQNSTGMVSSLFTSGLFNVEDLKIQNNNFSNKIIFSSVPQLGQKDYQFIFKNIQVLDNSFVTKTSYLFFSSLYSILQKPSHSAAFLQMTVQNNKLQKNNEEDLQQASFIQTSKIQNNTFEDIIFKNHHEISFSSIEYSNKVYVNNFDCINDKEYFDSSPNSASGVCLELYEILNTKIQTIKIEYKKAYDYDLINLYNKQYYNLSYFQILDGRFSNLILNQQTLNSQANPITIQSKNKLIFTLANCHFFDNNLKVIEDSQTFSTSALWIDNQLGTVQISDSTFKNSTSNQIYNFMFIETSYLGLKNVTFNKSSFEQDITKQRGGFMNLIVNSLKIVDSQFSKSKSLFGSFIYIQPFGDLLNIIITNTNFSEGYAQVDGGALYIDLGKSLLQFTCTNCFYDNIYTYGLKSSAVGIQKYRITTHNKIHEMVFKGGHIQNVFGVGDNFFIDVQNMKLSFIDIQQIRPQTFISKSETPISDSETPISDTNTLINQQFKQNASQQSTLAGSEYSEINIQGCKIQDYKIQNKNSKLPLLILAESTSISITDTIIQDGIFVRNTIKVINGTLSLKNTQFENNISQKPNSRQLSSNDETSNDNISSLIVMIDSEFGVSETSFIGTKCYNNCTGAVFYLMNTNFNLSGMNISDSEAEFGGSIFIQGLRQSNKIISSKFENNKALIDGGAIYLQALKDDNFKFRIEKCEILSNYAQSGKGGGLFIRSDGHDPANQLIEIQDSQFIGNIAQFGGGIFQKEISPKILGITIFKQNVGQIVGNDNLSYPNHLQLANIDKFFNQSKAQMTANNTLVISNFRSGDKLTNLTFELVNDQNEVIRPITAQEQQDFSVNVKVGKNDHFLNYSLRGNVSAPYDNKITKMFVFQDFDFIGIPGSQATLEFYSDQIYVLDKDKFNKYTQDYSFKIIVNFRDCIKGEIVQEYNSLTECKICSEGKYSFDYEICHACPSGATCAGAAQMVANQGYWRKTNESIDVLSCSKFEKCQGGTFGDHICFEGHIGALCEECDITGQYWNSSYSKSTINSCVKCDMIGSNIWFVLFMTLYTLTSIFLTIRGYTEVKLQFSEIHAFKKREQIRTKMLSSVTVQNLKSQENNQDPFKNLLEKNYSLKKSINTNSYYNTTNIDNLLKNLSDKTQPKNGIPIQKSIRNGNVEEEKSGIYIKILTNYFQIINSISAFNLQIPQGIFTLPSSCGEPLRNTTNSLDCLLKDYKTEIPYIYLRLLFSLSLPIAYFIIILLVLLIRQVFNRKSKFPWHILSITAMYMIIYVQPDLVAQMIALMSCRQIGDTKYILANVSYECQSDIHQRYSLFLIAPMLTIWVLILPLILFLFIYLNRENLNKIKTNLKYGYLYREYKRKSFYWEFIKMIQKIIIILTINFDQITIKTKIVFVYIIIVLYGILSIKIQPYQEQSINTLDMYSTTVCALTVLLTLLIYQEFFEYLFYPSLTIIIIINCLFILLMFKRIISIYILRSKKILYAALKKLAQTIPNLKIYLESTEDKKKINPVVKGKVKSIFNNFLSKTNEERQKVKINILKTDFNFTLTNMFGNHDEPRDNLKNSKINLACSNYEQNNLLLSNQTHSPLIHPIYAKEDNVNENDEENQQRRALARLLDSPDFKLYKTTDKTFDIGKSEVGAEEISGDWSSFANFKSKGANLLYSFSNYIIHDGQSQQKGDQSNSIVSSHQNLVSLPLLKTFSEQVKLYNQDENDKQKKDNARMFFLDDSKTNHDIPSPLNFKLCDIDTISKINLENRNNCYSQETQILYSLKNDPVNQDVILDDKIKEGQQIGDEQQIEQGQIEVLDKNNAQNSSHKTDDSITDQDLCSMKEDSSQNKVYSMKFVAKNF